MVIVDASVVYKWWDLKEADNDLAKKILVRHLQGQQVITVPDLIIYELVNAWVTKSNLSLSTIKRNIDDLRESSLEITNVSFDLIIKVADFSKKYKVSVYDSTYAVLAIEKKCDLITADKKFAKQVNLPFVKTLDPIS